MYISAFPGKQDLEDDAAANKRIVEPDNTFREKLQTFRKISEPQPEDSVPKGPKPPLSYKTLIGNNFSQTTTAPTPAMMAEHEVWQHLSKRKAVSCNLMPNCNFIGKLK